MFKYVANTHMRNTRASANGILDVPHTYLHVAKGNFRYSMPNVIMVDEKVSLFHQYLRYRHKWGASVFSIIGAIL